MANELAMRQITRRRGTILKLIRQNHEEQLDRMDDSDLTDILLKIGTHMSARQVVTMLQDMQAFGWVAFRQRFSGELERVVCEEIMLTAQGLALVTRRKNTDEVTFD